MSFHKGAIHCGSYSQEKMNLFLRSRSSVYGCAVIVIWKKILAPMLGSYDRTNIWG